MTTDETQARIDFFLRTIEKEKSSATVETYRRVLGIFTLWVDELGGNMELSTENLEEFPVYLRLRRKVTPKTVQTYLTALRQFFAFLSREGLLRQNPAEELRIKSRVMVQSRDILTEKEIKRLFEASEGDGMVQMRDRAILCFMLLEGLSEVEVSKSNFGDLTNSLMGEDLLIRGKGGPMRIYLDPRTCQSLRAYLAEREVLSQGDPMFVSHGPREIGERLKVRSVRGRMRMLLDRARIMRVSVSPQSLTHTSIYLQIQSGVSREELRRRIRPWRLFHRIQDLKAKNLIDPSF